MTAYQIFEISSLAVLLGILIFDLLVVVKRPHVPSMREATGWVVFYVSLALIFAGVLWWVAGGTHAGEFLTGWALEYSLSIDNLFVFVILMSRFQVPKEMQQRVLMIGILIAIVLRGIFIIIGWQLIERFSWIFYIFGAWLIWTAWKQAFGGDDDAGEKDNALVAFIKRRSRLSDRWEGGKVRVDIDGRRFFTPMLMVIIALGTTDLMFAIDSIPAIFSVTRDPFLVFACNIFALMGLRQLYFMLGGLLERLVYLHYGIAVILGFIGVKLVLHAMEANDISWINNGEPIAWVPHIETWHSLVVIVLAMAIATIASLVHMRVQARAAGEQIHLGPGEAQLGPDGHYHIVDALGHSFARPLRMETTETGTISVVDAVGQTADPAQFARDELVEVAREDLSIDEQRELRRSLDAADREADESRWDDPR